MRTKHAENFQSWGGTNVTMGGIQNFSDGGTCLHWGGHPRVEVGDGSNFFKVGFFGRWVFAIF